MPNTAVGLQSVFGTAPETTYGTVITPNRWYEILSESLERKQNVIQSSGIRAGTRTLRRGSRRAVTHRWGEGGVEMEVATKGFGRWFEQMLGGTPAITQPDSVGNPTVYQHVYSMGSLAGKSLTVQKGLRDQAGATVQQFTFHGCKVASWQLGIAVGEILKLSTTLDAEDVDTTTALAAHTFTDASVFHFAQGTLKVGGSSVAKVSSANISGNNSLKTDSFFLGTGGLKGQPEPNDFPSIEGSLSAEFESAATFYDRFTADSAAALVLEFEGGAISGTYKHKLTVEVPEVHFLGDTPKVNGPDVIVQDVPFEGAYDGTNAGVKVTLVTTDSAA